MLKNIVNACGLFLKLLYRTERKLYKMTWQEFEKKVRDIASSRWDCTATTETIAGVKCDCVLKPSEDEWILVEITQERDINKVRQDILKLHAVRFQQYSNYITCKCYVVMASAPTDAMRAAGTESHIKVMSVEEFQNEYFNYSNYAYIRSQKQFGSLINLVTGLPEENTYISVSYCDKKTGTEYYIQDIIDLLKKGRKIVLIGDFGLGKSRCVKQLFDIISTDKINNPYVFAINLRDHWGLKRGIEVLRRHFEELGLSANSFIKNFERPNSIYLLDGFDEIGTQTWSSDVKVMQQNRAQSVCAVKDLINNVQGGVLVTGRDYYFNSDSEMCSCLGLELDKTLILECNPEFKESEIIDFIDKNTEEKNGTEKLQQLPVWLPRRPLVIQLLLKYAGDIFSAEHALDDVCSFWYAFLNKICEREAKIYATLNPDVIKNVLILLANKTRTSKHNVGPITFSELSDAFYAVTGITPNDETSIMLQRLPTLGRVNADSPDRQFLDTFILNGLRAEGIIQLSKSWDTKIMVESWNFPLDKTGLSILTAYIEQDFSRVDVFLELARRSANSGNNILASDIVSAICLLDISSIDFKDLFVKDGHFSYLSFEEKEVHRLSIQSSIIEKLDITNAKLADTLSLCDCIISTAYGIASHESINNNSHFVSCEVESVEALATATLIKKARLSEPQKIFVGMLKKIFLQPGAGRKESTLVRGAGLSVNKSLCEDILRIMLDEKIVYKHKGDEGLIYSPERSETARVRKILADLTLSTDPLWMRISKLN